MFATAPPSPDYVLKLKADKEDLNRRIRERDASKDDQKRQHKSELARAKKTLAREKKSHASDIEDLADALDYEQAEHDTAIKRSEALAARLAEAEVANRALHAHVRTLTSRLESTTMAYGEAREQLAASRVEASSAHKEAALAHATIKSLQAERLQRDVESEITIASARQEAAARERVAREQAARQTLEEGLLYRGLALGAGVSSAQQHHNQRATPHTQSPGGSFSPDAISPSINYFFSIN